MAISSSDLTVSCSQTGSAFAADVTQALAAINSAHRSATAPTYNLEDGVMWLDTSSSDYILKMRIGGAWTTLLDFNGSQFETLGNLSLSGGDMTGNINFADNVKIQFGDSDDLEIYHDGTDSYISETGTGNLYIQATNFRINNTAGNAPYLQANDSGDVKLFHNGNQKIATTTNGVDVTGDITVSGTVDGVDIAARDAVLTSTKTTADGAIQKDSVTVESQSNGTPTGGNSGDVYYQY